MNANPYKVELGINRPLKMGLCKKRRRVKLNFNLQNQLGGLVLILTCVRLPNQRERCQWMLMLLVICSLRNMEHMRVTFNVYDTFCINFIDS